MTQVNGSHGSSGDGLGQCGSCTLVLHLPGWIEPATTRLRDAPVLSKTNRLLGRSWSLGQVVVRRQVVGGVLGRIRSCTCLPYGIRLGPMLRIIPSRGQGVTRTVVPCLHRFWSHCDPHEVFISCVANAVRCSSPAMRRTSYMQEPQLRCCSDCSEAEPRDPLPDRKDAHR